MNKIKAAFKDWSDFNSSWRSHVICWSILLCLAGCLAVVVVCIILWAYVAIPFFLGLAVVLFLYSLITYKPKSSRE